MATVEEHLEGLRNAFERVPRRFIRAGLLYQLDDEDTTDDPIYWYQPCERFEVDDIVYDHIGRNTPGPMISAIDLFGGGSARMNHAQPPTESELDQWVHHPPIR